MAATANFELEFAFVDETVTKQTYGPFATNDTRISNLKGNVKSFNVDFKRDFSDYEGLFANSNESEINSDNAITGATIITSEVTEYNLSANLLEEAANNG